MIRISFKKAAPAAAALASALSLFAYATPAQAVITPGQPAHPGETFTIAGSDTTEEFMTRWLRQDSGGNVADGNYNVPARPTSAFNVPADANCAARGYVQAPGTPTAPNGSSAGVTALLNDGNCIDAARSSRGKNAAAPAEAPLRFFAYGIDAVAVAASSQQAPASLTLAQVRAIYAQDAGGTCDTTNNLTWGDVGGSNLTGSANNLIRPFLPQLGSGTRGFFISNVLGTNEATVATWPCVVSTPQENTGRDAALTTSAAYQSAVIPYSVGQWIFQHRNRANTTTDVRNGFELLGMDGVCGDAPGGPTAAHFKSYVGAGATQQWNPATAVLNETNARAAITTPAAGCGVRFVYNVTRPGTPGFDVAEQIVGAGDPDGAGALVVSQLCSSGSGTDLSSVGFAAIPAGPLNNDGSGPTSVCRLNPVFG